MSALLFFQKANAQGAITFCYDNVGNRFQQSTGTFKAANFAARITNAAEVIPEKVGTRLGFAGLALQAGIMLYNYNKYGKFPTHGQELDLVINFGAVLVSAVPYVGWVASGAIGVWEIQAATQGTSIGEEIIDYYNKH